MTFGLGLYKRYGWTVIYVPSPFTHPRPPSERMLEHMKKTFVLSYKQSFEASVVTFQQQTVVLVRYVFLN